MGALVVSFPAFVRGNSSPFTLPGMKLVQIGC